MVTNIQICLCSGVVMAHILMAQLLICDFSKLLKKNKGEET